MYRALYVVVPVCTSSWMFVVFESVRICLVVLKVVFKYSCVYVLWLFECVYSITKVCII